MTAEKEKFEIEDLKEPEDLDIEEVVSEDAPKPVEEAPEEITPLTEDTDKDVLEKAVEEVRVVESAESPKVKNRRPLSSKKWLRYGLIALVGLLLAAALGYGGYLLWGQQQAEPTPQAETPVTEDESLTEEGQTVEVFRYINSEVGLNMRQTPSAKAKVLAIIPFGYKISILEEADGWVKTSYENKEGWVAEEFTAETDPLVYQDKTYGFELTFKSSWAGYKFIEADNSGSTTVKSYYVALPTTDKAWKEPTIPAGYASLFAMGVYTKAEWAKIAGGEMLPAKLGESTKYVYTYLPGQAYASDLKLQYSQIKEIIETFEVLN